MPRHPTCRLALVALGLGASLTLSGCVGAGPPLAPGLVDMSQATPGQTALIAQGGAGGLLASPVDPYGGAAFSAELWATPRLSVPMGVGAGGDETGTFANISTRAGVRYRVLDNLSLGGGLDWSHYVDGNRDLGRVFGVGPDLELSAGGRVGPERRIYLSGTLRPTVLAGRGGLSSSGATLFAVADMSVGYAVLDQLLLTAHLFGGLSSTFYRGDLDADVSGFLSGGIGLIYVLPAPR